MKVYFVAFQYDEFCECNITSSNLASTFKFVFRFLLNFHENYSNFLKEIFNKRCGILKQSIQTYFLLTALIKYFKNAIKTKYLDFQRF